MKSKSFLKTLTVVQAICMILVFSVAYTADVITNGTFDADYTTGWTNTSLGDGSITWDNTIFGNLNGSVKGEASGQNKSYELSLSQSIGNINTSDIVTLSLYWYKSSTAVTATTNDMIIRIIKPAGDSADIWSNTSIPSTGTPLSGTVTPFDVSSFFDQNGTYTLRLFGNLKTSNNAVALTQANFDDVVLDVVGGANAAPTIIADAPAVSPVSINKIGANTTTISSVFTDTDVPGVSAFSVTFKVREPNNLTEVILVNNLTNGVGGLTISDGGGGSYTASYTWDPGDAQTLGLYDLYFEVSDGTDNAIDDYTNNIDELTITEQNAPTLVSDATTASPVSVNRFGVNTTTISTVFTDLDLPGVNVFLVTFKVREPDNSTEIIMVNNLNNGNGGLTISDGGGGSYTASYIWNPDDAQTLGLYDLYFEVSDGTDNAIDDYTANADELTLTESIPATSPTVSNSATQVSISPVNRIGAVTTIISADFSDINQHANSEFLVTFKIREPNDLTELVLVNNLQHGAGGLTVSDNGGGSYTASYTYNPDDAQTIGSYDLYFEVDDGSGTGNAIDIFDFNSNELLINEIIANETPIIIPGITSVSPSSIPRGGATTTTFSVTFNDADDPGVTGFYITFSVNAPNSQKVITIADGLQNGQGGLTITAGIGDSYTASIDWDPPEDEIIGAYDLSCIVFDGIDSVADPFSSNIDELTITTAADNSPPVAPADGLYPSPIAVSRVGINPITLYTNFTDADAPAVSVFVVTFKVKSSTENETILANNLGDGQGGVTIVNQGGGVYTASVSWEPADTEELGLYDLYFHVIEGTDSSFDGYQNNVDELELYEVTSSNKLPTLTADNTIAIPNSVNRIGSDFTMIKSTFDDTDQPGISSFLITIKVRDAGLTEYTIVNNSLHGLNGLRIRHVSGSTYEASVLWNPPDAQVTGDYDLYIFIDDQNGGTVTDDFTLNSNELTLTSTAILGDGYLLHRTNNSDNCGGPNSACHNIAQHNTQTCVTCHTPHGSANIYMIKETISTPNSGDKPVLFKTLGTGDPFNSPDPTAGSDTHGAMADGSNAVYTEVCEVCHTSTKYYRNDGSQPSNHNHDVEDCRASCHTHADGFSPGAGAESSGGMSCSCHSNIFSAMDSTSLTYRHILANDDADYSPGASGIYSIKNCLTCHVDHDIFRDDLNPGIGQRSKNLRVDFETDPVIGNSSHLSNSDYSPSGLGGLCLSCHSGSSCNGCHSPNKSSFTHNFIPKADFDASDAHNYNVPSTFSTDGSIFNANCTKCHNDNMTKSYQSSTFKVSFHSSEYMKLLDTNGVISPTDPIEEQFCYKCHSTTSNPNAGSNLDYFGVKSMPNPDALDIEEVFTRTFTHPTETYSGRHSRGDSILTLGDGNRHAECEDCHNPHAAQTGTHDGSSNLVSGALKGVWGVEPTLWPTPATPTDNANVFTAPSGFTKMNPSTKEYQICLKCHSNYVTLPSGSRNLAEEINPNYPSSHAIVQVGDNPNCNSITMLEPWGTSKINYCSDCHRSNISTDPEGPHGSNLDHLLVATIVSDDQNGTPLCFVCHKQAEYWDGAQQGNGFPEHPSQKGAHAVAQGCFGCHMWEYSTTAGLGVSTTDWSGGIPPTGLFVHGQNKRWVFNESDGSAGTGQTNRNFVNGYIENMDFTNSRCWSENCKSHSNKGY